MHYKLPHLVLSSIPHLFHPYCIQIMVFWKVLKVTVFELDNYKHFMNFVSYFHHELHITFLTVIPKYLNF